MNGQELKALREAHGLTQRAMGALLGYGANYIMRLERGHEPITDRFAKLAHAMLQHRKPKKSS